MSKPDWKDAPKYCAWLAQDADGKWWWYRRCPAIGDHTWQSHHEMIYAGKNCKPNPDWTETLERRP